MIFHIYDHLPGAAAFGSPLRHGKPLDQILNNIAACR